MSFFVKWNVCLSFFINFHGIRWIFLDASKLPASSRYQQVPPLLHCILECLLISSYQSLLYDSGVESGWAYAHPVGHNLSCSPLFLNAHLQFALLYHYSWFHWHWFGNGRNMNFGFSNFWFFLKFFFWIISILAGL